MDSKLIFVRTNKGDDEIHNKTALLSGDIKRALLMVDGVATFGEISKRAAPSLRSTLDDMFKELEKKGLIQDKVRASNIPKIVVPQKMSTPLKKPIDDSPSELDFTSMFRVPTAEAMASEAAKAQAEKLKAEAEAGARAEAEGKARQEVEAAKLRAQQEAEVARRKAEQEAAKVRAELEAVKAKAEAEARAHALAEAKAKQEVEAARLKAEAEANARAEAEAKARSEAERRAREEADAVRLKAQQDAEAARRKAEQEAAKAREESREREEAEHRAREAAEAARARAELELIRAKTEAEEKVRLEAEAVKLKAQQEAEAARIKAEQEAAKAHEEAERVKQQAAAEAKAREEAERRAREEAEAARVKAEQEAARAHAELELIRAKAEAEEKARLEAEAVKLKAQQEAEAARIKAEQEAAKAHEEAEREKQQAAAEAKAWEEAEAAKLKAQQETEAARLKAERDAAKARAREEAEQRTKQEAEAMLLKPKRAVKPKPGAVTTSRSTSATVLFFDVVGYTKQPVNKQLEVKKQFNQLVTDCLSALGEGERIILDTGDGAAIGFLQHPEDALEVAMQFRKTVMANQHKDYPDLNVRIGIHLGPINVVKDMNDQSNMVGDGINDAQRVMSFAGIDQIYISRPYYDFVSRLSDEYAGLFQYRGLQKDKHGREHPVYELMDAAAPVAEAALPQGGEPAVAIKLEPFSFAMHDAVIPPAPVVAQEEPEPQQDVAALMGGIEQFKLPEQAGKPVDAAQVVQQQMPSASVPETPVKPAAEARMPSAEEVAELAEAQAKAWAEAERRSAEAAKSSAERAAQPYEAPHIATEVPTARASRKPIPWGKVGAGLFVVLLIVLFAVPYVLPMQGYVPKIEQMLAGRLKQPVHIGHLAGRLLPTPRLELNDVSIGEVKQIQAQQARVDFSLSALFSATKPVTGVNLEGVQVNGAALQQVSTWLQQIAADTQYPIARIELSQGKLEADGIQLSGVGGELNFDRAGKFVQAKLNAEGSKFALDINAAPDNKLQMAITVRGSALPLLPNWIFDELTAKGELINDELVITDLDGRILGGMLLGDARINWRSGWSAQGTLVAKTITTQNISKLLGGDMDGTARFQMQSANFAKLTDTAVLNGTFVIKKGVINGMDLVETARLRSRDSMPGGRTHFDELSGDLSYASGDYHFKQLKMSAGVLNATGTLDIAKQQLSGRISADLAMRAAMGTVVLQVDGATSSPSLRAAR